MGRRRLGAGGRPSRFEHDDGLDPGNGTRRAHELAKRGETLHVEHNAAHLGILPQIVQKVAKVDVEHTSHTHEVPEADLLLDRNIQNGGADGSALRNEGELPGQGHVMSEARIQAGFSGDDPQAIGPDESHIPFPRRLQDPVLHLATLFSRFLPPCGNNDRTADRCVRAFLDRLGNARDGNGDDRQVDGTVHGPQRLKAPEPEQLPIAGIDRIKRSFVAGRYHVLHQGTAYAPLLFACPDDRNRGGSKDSIQIVNGHGIQLLQRLPDHPSDKSWNAVQNGV